MEVLLDPQETELALALLLHRQGERWVLSHPLGVSVLYWKKQACLVRVPDFQFSIHLGLNVPNVDHDSLLSSLLFQYKRALKLGKKNEYDATLEAQTLQTLRKRSVSHFNDPELVEAMLGRAHAEEVDALYADDRKAFKARCQWQQAESDDDDTGLSDAEFDTGREVGNRNRFFELQVLEDKSKTYPSLFQVRCRNHVVAMTLALQLLPLSTHPGGNAPPGQKFFVGDGVQGLGTLVSSTNHKPVYRFNQAPANAALALVALPLGTSAPLLKQFIVPTGPLPGPPRDTDAFLLVPAATHRFHPVFGSAGSRPHPDLLVKTRIQPSRDTSQVECVLFDDPNLRYLGLLTRDCVLDKRFPGTVPPSAQPKAKARPLKRAKSQPDTAGLPLTKRVRLMWDSMPFRVFLGQLKRATNLEDLQKAFPPLRETDFMETLAHCPRWGGTDPTTVRLCLQLAVDQGWVATNSTVANIIREKMVKVDMEKKVEK